MSDNYDKDFPFEIKDIESELNKELLSKWNGERTGFVRVGPKGYIFPKKYERKAALYYNMPVRPSDVFVVTFPRSGTTWTQELVWLIANDFDYQKAADVSLIQRFLNLEYSILFHPVIINEIMEENKGNEKLNKMISESMPDLERLRDAPSPRFIKTHLPLSLLPPALADTARVVYVARDPRDVAVSYYYLFRLLRFLDFKVYLSPYFEHVKEGWQRHKRYNENVLFLFYEELSKDMPNTIRRVAKFLDKPITDEQMEKLTEHLKIDNFKENMSVNSSNDTVFYIPGQQPFIRTGRVGGWRDYFDEKMARQAERWIGDNLRGTDLHFPSMDVQ